MKNPPCRHAVPGVPVCRRCAGNRARAKAWALANPDRARVRSASWKADPTNKDRILAYWARYRARHRGRIRDCEARISARVRGSKVLTIVRLDDIYDRDRGVCQLCGWDVPPPGQDAPLAERPSMDHVVPVSEGGAHSVHNVRLAHVGCNRKRNTGYEWERQPAPHPGFSHPPP